MSEALSSCVDDILNAFEANLPYDILRSAIADSIRDLALSAVYDSEVRFELFDSD